MLDSWNGPIPRAICVCDDIPYNMGDRHSIAMRYLDPHTHTLAISNASSVSFKYL